MAVSISLALLLLEISLHGEIRFVAANGMIEFYTDDGYFICHAALPVETGV